MKRSILKKNFFNEPTFIVAKNLLGKFLVIKKNGSERAFMIAEVEAYDGFSDRGSHGSRGITPRTKVMYGPPGHWYTYFTYGMHWMLNIVTREENYPAAVLIRGLEGIKGPGRVTKTLGIDGSFYGKPATKLSGLWMEDRGMKIDPKNIKKGPRIGIDYAGPYWAKRHWRFWIEE